MTESVTVEYVQTRKGRVHKRYVAPSGATFTDERDNLDQAELRPFTGDFETARKCRRCFA